MDAYLIIGLLIILSGIFSGLNLGLLSLSKSDLKRKVKLNDKDVTKIYEVRKNGNLLLTTLLLGNVIVNSVMSIFLAQTTGSGLSAVIISTSLITVFGEILPQALFSRYPEKLSIKLLWLVKLFIFILYPITRVISYILDKILGDEIPTIMKKSEIAELIRDHEDSPSSAIDEDEERILLGALTYSDKTAQDILTPKSVVYSLDNNRKITFDLLNKIKNKGFSRIPVYSGDNDHVVGVLYAKSLIDLNPNKNLKVSNFSTSNPLRISENIKLDKLFNLFIKNKNHIAFVYDEYEIFSGIITLEDIIEEILKVQIVDEQDNIEDMQVYAKENNKYKTTIS